MNPKFYFLYDRGADSGSPNLHVCDRKGTRKCRCSVNLGITTNMTPADKRKRKKQALTQVAMSDFESYRICGVSYDVIRDEITRLNQVNPPDRQIELPDLVEHVVYQY